MQDAIEKLDGEKKARLDIMREQIRSVQLDATKIG